MPVSAVTPPDMVHSKTFLGPGYLLSILGPMVGSSCVLWQCRLYTVQHPEYFYLDGSGIRSWMPHESHDAALFKIGLPRHMMQALQ
jgi:hypothetical protein